MIYVYSVISVIDKRLPGNTKKWTLVRSWLIRVRLVHSWAASIIDNESLMMNDWWWIIMLLFSWRATLSQIIALSTLRQSSWRLLVVVVKSCGSLIMNHWWWMTPSHDSSSIIRGSLIINHWWWIPPKNGLIALQTPRTSRLSTFYYCQVVNRAWLRLLSTYILV